MKSLTAEGGNWPIIIGNFDGFETLASSFVLKQRGWGPKITHESYIKKLKFGACKMLARNAFLQILVQKKVLKFMDLMNYIIIFSPSPL